MCWRSLGSGPFDHAEMSGRALADTGNHAGAHCSADRGEAYTGGAEAQGLRRFPRPSLAMCKPINYYGFTHSKGGDYMAPTYPSKRRYDAENVVRVAVGFNRRTEPELVEVIEAQENRAGYLKELVKRDVPRFQAERRAEEERGSLTALMREAQASAERKRPEGAE